MNKQFRIAAMIIACSAVVSLSGCATLETELVGEMARTDGEPGGAYLVAADKVPESQPEVVAARR